MTENGHALVTGKPYLLAIPLLDAGIKIELGSDSLGGIHAPVGGTNGVAHAHFHQFLFGCGQFNGEGHTLLGILIALTGAAISGDVIKLRLGNGSQLHAQHQEGVLFLCLGHARNRVAQVAEKVVVIIVGVVGDAHEAQLLFLGCRGNALQRVAGVIGILAVNMPVGMYDHVFVLPKNIFGNHCRFLYSITPREKSQRVLPKNMTFSFFCDAFAPI